MFRLFCKVGAACALGQIAFTSGHNPKIVGLTILFGVCALLGWENE